MISPSNSRFWFLKSFFKNPKSFSLIPLESHFGTQKSEISDVENPEIDCFRFKIQFFSDQNLDFVLGLGLTDVVDC